MRTLDQLRARAEAVQAEYERGYARLFRNVKVGATTAAGSWMNRRYGAT